MANLTATAADLPPAVAAALASATPDLAGAERRTLEVGGIPWASVSWGDPADAPVLLVHGVTSNADTYWRIGPAIAAGGRHVVAVDLPGHGRTGHWSGRHRFAETATDLAGWIRASGLAARDLAAGGLAVLGHSWGAMVVAALPAAGLRPERMVLLDPPVLPLWALEMMTKDPLEHRYDDLGEAMDAIRSANLGWSEGDVRAKALGLTQFTESAALAILLENGEWDGGLAALADPAAAGIPTWVIRGVPEAGCFVPDAAVPAFRARVGHDHVITIADAPHSPQRTHPEATTLAILRALGIVPNAVERVDLG